MMSNPPTLQQAKEIVRTALRGMADVGIIGVGIDPTHQTLLVFVDQDMKAKKFLKDNLGAGFPVSRLRPAEESFLSRFHRRLGNAFGALFQHETAAATAPVSLKPGSKIEPDGGDPGRLGCIVYLQDGTPAALTVEHIFRRRDSQVVYKKICDSMMNCRQRAGASKSFGALQADTTNSADCALFLPDQSVSLSRDGAMTGNFVQAAQAASTSEAKVTNLGSGVQGKVLDPDATIKYTVSLGNSTTQKILFDNQILVEGPQFGSPGDSGSLVIMAQNGSGNSFLKGDALGLYSAVITLGTYHFVTPMHACMTTLGAASIY
jgi:hypothetical protein